MQRELKSRNASLATDSAVPTLARIWDEFERTRRALTGVRIERLLSGHPMSVPRISGTSNIAALSFAGPGRHLQVLFGSGQNVRAQFWPARPGTLSIPHPTLPEPPATRTLLSTAPVDLELSAGPTLYEELAPVQVRVEDGSAPVVASGLR